MAFHDEPLFEFNRFAPWELFCSTYRAGREAENAKSPIERLHFNRSMLLFAFAAIEAMLNYMVEKLATAAGEDKTSFIRNKRLLDKLDYVEQSIGQPIPRTAFDQLMEEYAFLRHEIVHFKRTDQQPQFHVQHVQPPKFLRLLQVFFVRCFVATHGEFPYWITGWNYTGFNGSWRDLYLSNNANGLSHTLGRMNFSFKPLCGPGSMGFAGAHMATLEHFDALQAFLAAYPHDVETMSSTFPQRPRLVRRWWLPTVIDAVEGEVFAALGWGKPKAIA
jgi:hypothetical protein